MKPTYNKYKSQDNNINIRTRQNKKEEISPNNATQNPIAGERQVISGYFVQEKSYKELVIARFNTFLYFVLGGLILFCFVCYYFVSCKEMQLNQISRATLELNYENDELQNKIDSLQSYYNIDKAVSKNNILERAKQVVEVKAVDVKDYKPKKMQEKVRNKSLVVGY